MSHYTYWGKLLHKWLCLNKLETCLKITISEKAAFTLVVSFMLIHSEVGLHR